MKAALLAARSADLTVVPWVVKTVVQLAGLKVDWREFLSVGMMVVPMVGLMVDMRADKMVELSVSLMVVMKVE